MAGCKFDEINSWHADGHIINMCSLILRLIFHHSQYLLAYQVVDSNTYLFFGIEGIGDAHILQHWVRISDKAVVCQRF